MHTCATCCSACLRTRQVRSASCCLISGRLRPPDPGRLTGCQHVFAGRLHRFQRRELFSGRALSGFDAVKGCGLHIEPSLRLPALLLWFEIIGAHPRLRSNRNPTNVAEPASNGASARKSQPPMQPLAGRYLPPSPPNGVAFLVFAFPAGMCFEMTVCDTLKYSAVFLRPCALR